MDKFNEFRKQYSEFIFEKYEIEEIDNYYNITYYFEIPGLTSFRPMIIVKKTDNKYFNQKVFKNIVFNIGMVELVSYFKCTCSPNVIIKAGYLDNDQIEYFKNLYYNGLGEFLYINNVNISKNELMTITCQCHKEDILNTDYIGNGNLIPVGGGKDSVVSLEILKGETNNPFIINPKDDTLNCAKMAGYKDDEIITIIRKLDRKIVEINNQGFLNGHTPFSAIVAFNSFLAAYLNGKKYIVLSNESSANEETVIGTNINHQYSKTYEFENDFNNYISRYFNLDIKYFSLLRPLSEFQIALLFSNYKQYHKIFRSCNLGSKKDNWLWCCECPKCLFVYIILSPFLTKEEMINIFGKDLYESKELLNTFIEVLGYSKNKPFECVGTYGEAKYAVSLVINKSKNELPYLLQYYKDNYPLELDRKIEKEYNNQNNLDEYFEDKLKKELDKYV